MKSALSFISIFLYLIVGIICLVMAYKSIFSKKYLSFHEKAAGKPWESLNEGLQYVILTILKVSGFGFLVVALLLITFPIFNYFMPHTFIKYSTPIVSFIYCFGLFLL